MNHTLFGASSARPYLDAPHLFRHIDLIRSFESAKTLPQEELINLLNYMHFSDQSVFVLLEHPVHEEHVLIRAFAEPCLATQTTLRWDENVGPAILRSYPVRFLFILQDQSIVCVPLHDVRLDNGTLLIHLPERGYILNKRRSLRHYGHGVSAELVQNGLIGRGELVDFGHRSFRIVAKPEGIKIKNWFHADAPTWVRLHSRQGDIFCGNCRCTRTQRGHESQHIVFDAENDRIARFQPKKIRNPRLKIAPPLSAVFQHPILQKRIQKDISDLSTTGFSITDRFNDALLMPGMIISGLSINRTGVAIATCIVQIIYRRNESGATHYGVAILDMDIHAYSRINHLLGAHADPHISVSTEVDLEALWEFFFRTGFIYPKKYGFFHAQRKSYIETYRKLYQDNPGIARHITYEENGKIFGHMSMVRAYERAWLIQHHAARPMENKMPGYVVLRHIILFLHGAYTLPSAKMDHVICFFRPENKFPERVFGGFARDLNNPQGCSVDVFSYRTVSSKDAPPLPEAWALRPISRSDMWKLEHCYRRMSGGLFLEVVTRLPEPGEESLTQTSARHGFTRKWELHGLFLGDNLACALISNQSDFGMNLSEFLNSITAVVVDPDALSWEVLSAAVSRLAGAYRIDNIPLLIYPDDILESKGVQSEKHYKMWITDMGHSNLFLEYVQRKFRMKYE